MKKITQTATNIILLATLLICCFEVSPFILFGKSYFLKGIKIFKYRHDFELKNIKLDSLTYSETYGEGAPNPIINLHGKIGDEYYELRENPEIIVAQIENEKFSMQKVWYNKNFKKVFLKTDEQNSFPWMIIFTKDVLASIIFLVIPLIIVNYLLKNIIQFVILIYKKEYYNKGN